MSVTVGCDPEFLLKKGDIKVSVPTAMRHTSTAGSIGQDHCGRVGEIRPRHGSPKEVVENIRTLMTWIKNRYPGYQVIAGGGGGDHYHESIGGHIHIGGISLSLSYSSATRYRNRYRRRSRGGIVAPSGGEDNQLVLAFDYFIGRRLKKVNGGSRPRGSSYGKNSDIESKIHGFEYRTPPSWITDPILAEAVLAVAQRIVIMWKAKPMVFEDIFGSRKSIARKADYRMLIPPSGPDRAYMQTQVANLKKVLYSKTYRMDNPDVLDMWTSTTALNRIWGRSTATDEDEAPRRRGRRSTRTTPIQLQVSQLKMIDYTREFMQETVMRVVRFATPEVKVYAMQDYTPWSMSLVRDIRLRPDTIYFSKELRPYLRLHRNRQFRTRFVEIQSRSTNGTITNMTNAVFFNASRSDPAIREEIVTIFENCVRTKIKVNAEM